MKLYKITDTEFSEYGKVIEMDLQDFVRTLSEKDCPDNGTVYVPSDEDLERTPLFRVLQRETFGGLPIQIGYCNGHNDLLNCLEYHKSSEVNVAETDTVLLLGKLQEVQNHQYDTSLVKAFLLPSGSGVELYATTLHYAPCGIAGNGFRVAVVLPKGTNTAKPADVADRLLWANNKWLYAHKDSNEAKQGAFVGLVGENIRL